MTTSLPDRPRDGSTIGGRGSVADDAGDTGGEPEPPVPPAEGVHRARSEQGTDDRDVDDDCRRRGVPTGCSGAIDPATKRTNTIGRRRDRPTRTLYGPLDRADAAVYESLGDAELEAMRRVLRGTCEVDERHAVWLRELGTPSEGG